MTATAARGRAALEKEHALHLLREMLRIRRFEEKAAEMYSLGKIRGFLHLYIGEEACAVGAMQALGPDDAVVATYRDHGHALARGLPIAIGLALADRLQGRERVTACFFGEGAVAEGEFHETLNLAALWRLPVLFLCENNLYAMGTALERSEAQTDLRLKVQSYAIPAEAVDGMDVLAVEKAARDAAKVVRPGAPYFLELRTYRFRAHSMADPELYRAKDEVERWKERDPIETFAARLRETGLLAEADLAALEAEVAAEIADAVAEAEAGEWEPVEELTKDVTTPR